MNTLFAAKSLRQLMVSKGAVLVDHRLYPSGKRIIWCSRQGIDVDDLVLAIKHLMQAFGVLKYTIRLVNPCKFIVIV